MLAALLWQSGRGANACVWSDLCSELYSGPIWVMGGQLSAKRTSRTLVRVRACSIGMLTVQKFGWVKVIHVAG